MADAEKVAWVEPGIRHRTLHGQILDVLGGRIMSGHYAPGAWLPTEDHLAVELQVSRGPIREAVKVLAAKRLVTVRPRSGTVVSPRDEWNLLDPDVIRWRAACKDRRMLGDLFQLRLMLEPHAARLAAESASAEQCARLVKAYAGMRDSADSADTAAFVAYDVAFHLALLAATGNELLSHLAALLEPSLAYSMDVTSHGDHRLPNVLELHGLVLDAVKREDGATAENASRSLISATAQRLGGVGGAVQRVQERR
jgi:DNA-binding FadR family transcriptional regulator